MGGPGELPAHRDSHLDPRVERPEAVEHGGNLAAQQRAFEQPGRLHLAQDLGLTTGLLDVEMQPDAVKQRVG